MSLKLVGGASQPVSLTPGAAATITDIAAEINLAVTDITASVDGETGSLVLTTDDTADDLVVEAPADNANATLGLTAGTYAHEPQTDQFSVKIADGESQVFTLTPGSRTITQVVADFAAAVGFAASAVSGKLRLTTDDLQNTLEIEAVTGDCYTALGFEPDVYDETWSHNPAAIQGIMIAGPDPCSVAGTIREPFAITTGSNDKIKLPVRAGGSQEFTLAQATAATAQDIADTINLTATDVTASAVAGRLVLTANASWQDIEIEAIANDAYDALGLEAAVTAFPTAIQTLERA